MRKIKVADGNASQYQYEYEPERQPIEDKIRRLLNKLPTPYKLKDETIQTYKNLTIERRNILLQTIDLYISNLERHLEQWRKVRQLIKVDGVQRVK